MKHTTTLLTSAFVLVAASSLYAGDFTVTAPVRPSQGFLNDYLRKDDPYMAAWDVGAQVRLRYEVKDNIVIAGAPGSLDFRDHGADVDNSYLLLRVRPRVGYTGEWFSAMVEGRHSSSTGDDRNPNAESDGPIDLHQAFVTIGNHKEFPLSVKIGRQELSYGDERLVGAFAWNNIGRTFDAAKLRWQNPWFGADFFTSRLVVPDDNNFNVSNEYETFSGMYATTKKVPKQTTDIYFLSRNANAQSPALQLGNLVPTPSARDIYTIGLRGKSNPGELGNWDYTYELMAQFGHFNDTALPAATASLSHEAYALFAGGGYTWAEMSMTPRVGVEYNYASGDSNPTDGKHETFENLFPTNHKFYGFMDFVSLQNIHNVRLQTSIKPIPRLTLLLEGQFFWLADTSDNFYAVTGARRGGIAATPGTGYGINPGYSSYVGSEIDLVATYQVSPHITVEAAYCHFFRGDYVKQSLSGAAFGSTDANYFYVQTNFSF
ncbi:MAG: hypothetical protein K0Q55_717 [Verrucomicrobia bacterium]|jgi:hypothetical protein|nr:hypothetical protein [Verrucomicrobiota bacterium]